MVKQREDAGMDFGIRVGAVVERNGEVLLVRHEKPGLEPYWVLPGGRLEPGESIPECARREVLEETGLEAEFSGVLYVSEFMREGRHTVDITARMDVGGDPEAVLGGDPEVEPGAEPTLKELRWVPTEELAEIELVPSWVRTRLIEDAPRDLPPERVYLGGGRD
ncbi:MAG: NUDIX domain-containing protein [Rubrobacteraceae bacterium]